MTNDAEFIKIRENEWKENNKEVALHGSRFSDVHLLYPCAFSEFPEAVKVQIGDSEKLKSNEEIFHVTEKEEDICDFFLGKMKEYNNSELIGEFTRNIVRKNLGIHEIVIQYGNAKLKERGIIYYSRHISANVGMVSIVLPFTSIPASLLLTALCAGVLMVVDENGKDCFLQEWIHKKQISVQGSPKAVVFENDDVSKEEIIKCLACEYEPMSEINGEIFCEWCEENFAQYSLAKVHASDSCLYYEIAEKEMTLKERLNQQAVEMFFVELLLMQEAAINLVCNKVYAHLNEETENKKKNSQETLFELSKEAANAVLFVNYKNLRYPTVRVSARKIAQRFGIDEDMEKYYKCREVLEQMIGIKASENDSIDNRLMNMLLLILTMLQVLPTLSQVVYMLLTKSVQLTMCVSVLFGTMGCVILYIIYRLCYYAKIRKNEERLFGKRRKKK